MMREILFRGKKIDNDEWTYGFYFEHSIDGQKYSYIKYQTFDEGFVTNEVVADTVGQFTGLTDKNGKKIFEGDIVESPNGTQGFIEWQNAECAFLVNIGDDWQTMDDCPYEVIGNIYDNKEEEE